MPTINMKLLLCACLVLSMSYFAVADNKDSGSILRGFDSSHNNSGSLASIFRSAMESSTAAESESDINISSNSPASSAERKESISPLNSQSPSSEAVKSEENQSTSAALPNSSGPSVNSNSQSLASSGASKQESAASESTVKKMETLTEIFNNESRMQSSGASSEASTFEGGKNNTGRKSTIFSFSSETGEVMSTSTEKEGVILGTGHPVVPMPKSVLQKTVDWMGDAYTLSILIPIAAGVVFASTIIVTIAFCRCVRRSCRRRRLRRKALPESVKNLRPSDRARLLAESTDEEF